MEELAEQKRCQMSIQAVGEACANVLGLVGRGGAPPAEGEVGQQRSAWGGLEGGAGGLKSCRRKETGSCWGEGGASLSGFMAALNSGSQCCLHLAERRQAAEVGSWEKR